MTTSPDGPIAPKHPVTRFLRNNGLTLVVLGLFAVTLVGQIFSGLLELNAAQQEHGDVAISLLEYLGTGHFREAIFENWESEFLQMGMYVLLTIWLRQKGSPESKKLDEPEEVDADPKQHRNDRDAPWAVRKGGLTLAIYQSSLSIAFFAMFIISLLLHANGGAAEFNSDQAAHGSTLALTTWQYMTTSRFWFESFQNWQSEFLSIGAIVYLSVYLRQRGSPESKAVHAPHAQTGSG
ncbi:MAG TPA: DUF6766 family protein [Acidimicrobiales bacterium]|nr:DUF6766 family protein [Acidimicrobiales bacterium]